MTNVYRQQVRVEYQRGGGDQAVGVVDPAIGTSVLPGKRIGSAGDAFVDGDPGDGRKELLKSIDLLVSRAGEEFKAGNFAGDHRFFSVNEPPEKIDRWLGATQMIDGDARVQQLHVSWQFGRAPCLWNLRERSSLWLLKR
jgi:hypothetical protein